MAKKPALLSNRLARTQADRRSGVVAAILQPTDENRPLPEVAWDVLTRPARSPYPTPPGWPCGSLSGPRSAPRIGWVAGICGLSLAHPSGTDPLADPKLRAIEDEVIAALGPDVKWYTNGEHPLPAMRTDRRPPGRSPILDSMFDPVITARGSGLDLVLARADED